MILKKLVVGPFGSNCYIVGDDTTKEGMIIDPGAEGKKILKQVRDLELNIKYIVLTHGHIDHIGAVNEVKAGTGAQFLVHSGESSLIQGGASDLFGMSRPSLPAPDKWLQGGDTIDISGLHFLVLHTPGHSPGGICLFGHGVVFSGDTLFNYGIGRTDFPSGSFNQLMNSIYTKLMVLPDNTIVYPGHGPDSAIGAERRGNPFLRS
jgi:glyoxylase-like metal-dependent hydrolase (beta-lactamase superfamily II)